MNSTLFSQFSICTPAALNALESTTSTAASAFAGSNPCTPLSDLDCYVAMDESALSASPSGESEARLFESDSFKSSIDELLRREQMIATEGAEGQTRAMPLVTQIPAYLDGRTSFPRLEGLHRLLCGAVPPSEITAVENGAVNISNAVVFAKMGSHVAIKEADVLNGKMLQFQLDKLPADIRSLITFIGDSEKIHAPLEAHISYWANPSPFRHAALPHGGGAASPASENSLVDYMGRDVMPGGFLVIQADHGHFFEMPYDQEAWELLYSQFLDPLHGFEGTVLNTVNFQQTSALIIYRRR